MDPSYLLYAEDDADDVDIMIEMVSRQPRPHPLVCVGNGFDLLKYLQRIPEKGAYPALIILDLKLPKLNGLETLELLRTDDLYRLIPVVMFTSKASFTEKERCQALGAEVLSKPLAYSDWPGTLNRFSAYLDE